jgi:hypothetical protein
MTVLQGIILGLATGVCVVVLAIGRRLQGGAR